VSQKPALIIMAAGIGSRYGGLKQVDPIGPNGEIVIDYAIYDALRAGFGKVVFLIRKDIEEVFRERIGRKIEQHAETIYAFQELSNVPAGFTLPEERKKPWGTGHAVLSCKGLVDEPFAVINADDFYGPGAFQALADRLCQSHDQPGQPYDYCMVGYTLSNTLSEHGTVARGVCTVTADGLLVGVQERTKIQRLDGQVKYTEDSLNWIPIPADSIVSMNMFGFTPSFFDELQARFPRFLEKNAHNLLKAEFFLPDVVNQLLQEGKAQVKVLPTDEKWFGVTYPEDRPFVQAAIRELIQRGVYPENLWA
jgi:NDP-sugar pyrophosphorylase family protein